MTELSRFLMLGQRDDVHLRNREFPFAASWIDAVLLSHAHIDHCGNLPGLFRAGFRGPIYCTPATADLTAVMLRDSLHIQQEDASYLAGLAAPASVGNGPPIEPLYGLLQPGGDSIQQRDPPLRRKRSANQGR